LYSSGERTRSHYFGESPDRYTTIDMYRRPATNYSGRVVMDCGRPGDGYYTQKFPCMFYYATTWHCFKNEQILVVLWQMIIL